MYDTHTHTLQHDLPFELHKQVLDTIGASSLPHRVLQGNARALSSHKIIPAGTKIKHSKLACLSQGLDHALSSCYGRCKGFEWIENNKMMLSITMILGKILSKYDLRR